MMVICIDEYDDNEQLHLSENELQLDLLHKYWPWHISLKVIPPKETSGTLEITRK